MSERNKPELKVMVGGKEIDELPEGRKTHGETIVSPSIEPGAGLEMPPPAERAPTQTDDEENPIDPPSVSQIAAMGMPGRKPRPSRPPPVMKPRKDPDATDETTKMVGTWGPDYDPDKTGESVLVDESPTGITRGEDLDETARKFFEKGDGKHPPTPVIAAPRETGSLGKPRRRDTGANLGEAPTVPAASERTKTPQDAIDTLINNPRQSGDVEVPVEEAQSSAPQPDNKRGIKIAFAVILAIAALIVAVAIIGVAVTKVYPVFYPDGSVTFRPTNPPHAVAKPPKAPPVKPVETKPPEPVVVTPVEEPQQLVDPEPPKSPYLVLEREYQAGDGQTCAVGTLYNLSFTVAGEEHIAVCGKELKTTGEGASYLIQGVPVEDIAHAMEDQAGPDIQDFDLPNSGGVRVYCRTTVGHQDGQIACRLARGS